MDEKAFESRWLLLVATVAIATVVAIIIVVVD